jgi:hypothetical protein
MQSDENASTTLATCTMPQSALIVHAHWLNLILDGTKTWEIRGGNTTKRERIALATTKPYVLLGDVEIVKSTNISHEEFQAHVDLHCVPKKQHADVIGRYKQIYAWHVRFPRRYATPIGYKYSPGQVKWIKLHEQQHIFTRLAADLASSAQQSGNRQQARLAAERRATAEVQRGIGDMEHVRSMQASASSRKDIFGEAAASKLRENLKRKRALSGTPITTPSHAAQTQESATPAAVLVPSVTPTTRSVVFADALVLTHHRRQILKDSHLLPHLIVARPMPVSRTLHRFLQHRFQNNVDIRSSEVGGDGDCLFHSVAAGLEHLLLESTAASRHVLRHVPLTVFSSDRLAVVQHLRNMCAEQIDTWSWEELLNYYVRACMDQELGEWRDLWNPTALLREYNLEILIGCDTVRAVSDNPNGDVGDIFIIIDKSDARVGGNTSQQLQTPIAQGRAFLMALRVELQNVFRTLGNTHWGDYTDAR